MASEKRFMHLVSPALTKTLLDLDDRQAKYLEFRILAHPEDVDEILRNHLSSHGIRGHLQSRGMPLDLCQAPVVRHLPSHMQTLQLPYNLIKEGLQETGELKPVFFVDKGRLDAKEASDSDDSEDEQEDDNQFERSSGGDAMAGVECEIKVAYASECRTSEQRSAGQSPDAERLGLRCPGAGEVLTSPVAEKRPAPSPPSGSPAKRLAFHLEDSTPCNITSVVACQTCRAFPSNITPEEYDAVVGLSPFGMPDFAVSLSQPTLPLRTEGQSSEQQQANGQEGDRCRSSLGTRSPSPMTRFTRRRLAYRNPIPNFNKKDGFHLIHRVTDYAQYLYGRPPDIEEKAVKVADESQIVGHFSEETCRGKMVQTFSLEGLMPENDEDDPMIDELIEMAGYETASPYPDSDDPHCHSPFPCVSRFLDCEDPYRGEYGLASDTSGSEGELSDGEMDPAYKPPQDSVDSDSDLKPFAEEKRWMCGKCESSNHPLDIRCTVCDQWRRHTHLSRLEESKGPPASGSRTSTNQEAEMGDSQDSGIHAPVQTVTIVTDSCLVCADAPRTGCFIHGGTAHNVTCYDCARRIQRSKKPCPICRRTIDHVVRLCTE